MKFGVVATQLILYSMAFATSPHLNSKKAVELANREATSRGYKVAMYPIISVKYLSPDRTWVIGYHLRAKTFSSFSVEVGDQTGRATLVLPEGK